MVQINRRVYGFWKTRGKPFKNLQVEGKKNFSCGVWKKKRKSWFWVELSSRQTKIFQWTNAEGLYEEGSRGSPFVVGNQNKELRGRGERMHLKVPEEKNRGR